MKKAMIVMNTVLLGCSIAFASEQEGLRDVQIRTDHIVTVWLGVSADESKLKDLSCYSISSKDDPDFAKGLKPVSIARFGRASVFRHNNALMDNLMHLTLEKGLKPGKTYTVSLSGGLLPANLKQSAEFSLDQTPNPSFKVNQVGYSKASHVKLAYLSSYLGDGEPADLSIYKTFEVRDAKTNKKVLEGKIETVSDKDPFGLDKLYVLNLSALTAEGEFYIWVDGLGRSYTFKNGDCAAQAMFDVCSRGLYFQRSGTEIKPPYAGKWPRPMAHATIYVPHANLPIPWGKKFNPADPSDPYYCPEGPLEIHGGHYDAGDYDLRPMHINVPELLLSLYEAMPQKFHDGQVNIPESGNGIPDILDEAAWNLLSLEYIQDYAAKYRNLQGGVAPGKETYTHPHVGGHGNGGDPYPYLMRRVTPYFSFAAAAEFAHAARVFKPFDAKRAEKYLQRAEAAYQYAVAHKDETYPKENQGEDYNAKLLNSAWCWAAGQLFSTTGKSEYWQAFKERYAQAEGGVAGSISRWEILWPIITTKQPGVDKEIQQELTRQLFAEADKGVQMVEKNGKEGYRASLYPRGGWGSSSCVVKNIEATSRAYLITRKQEYLDAIATSVDFSLGMNPSEMSWMTGAGTVYPMNPCNLNSYDDKEPDPLPGILIYGPVDSWKDKFCAMYPDKAEMGFYRRVVDCWRYIAGCEYTVWETQAPFMYAVGMLLPDGAKPR